MVKNIIGNLTFVDVAIVSSLLLVGIIILGYFIGYFGSYGLDRAIKKLDRDILKENIKILRLKLLSLDSRESVNSALDTIRLMETELDVAPVDLTKELEAWEDTLTLTEKRGYI